MRYFYPLLVLLFCQVATILAQPQIRAGETIECGARVDEQHGLRTRKINTQYAHTDDRISQIKNADPIFEIKYTGFTEEAKAAFQYAIDIWEQNLQSDVKIKIFANWAFVENISTLAFVTPTEVKNFEGAPIRNLWYPIALAEKLARKDINPTTEADIVATFNNRRTDWYFGTDGNCPADKLDLVTVVLHEIGHGLGFSGTFRVSNASGSYGLSDGNPKIYDTYLRNGFNTPLLNFSNGSADLGSQLTNNSVVFESLVARTLGSTSANPRVYAPNPFEPGSSISHLDEGTYEDTPNALMTPFASYGKVVHNPGPLVRGIFYEMGWLNTYIDHTPLTDRESNVDIPFSITLRSDTAIDNTSVTLHYSFDAFQTELTAQMLNGVDNKYEISFSTEQSNVNLSYYFTLDDVLGRSFRLPLQSTGTYSFFLGLDVTPPVITHTPKEYILPIDVTLPIEVNGSDNIGLRSVKIEYKVNETGEVHSVDMSLNSPTLYEATINLVDLGLVSGDVFFYKIIATDSSSNSNVQRLPQLGFFQIPIKVFPPVDLYSDDFSSDLNNFYGDFSITKPTGFSDNAIHSPHPYPVSTELDQAMDLVYTLLVPIVVSAENSLISFREVVLIEPGVGDDYLNPAFKDYVIVEGALRGSQEWMPLLTGYDSRTHTQWLDYYNSQLNKGNSNAIGTLNYFKDRRIDLLNTFTSGQEVLVRFRLHSDGEGRGWGWAIDNLTIQGEIVSIDQLIESKEMLYPNPTTGMVSLTLPGVTALSLYRTDGNLAGTVRRDDYTMSFNLGEMAAGLYLVRYSDGKRVYYQKLVITD